MSQANVRSIDAIRDFKAALIGFAEDARIALDSMEMEIRQTRNWLERDQVAYWKAQVKRCHEQIAESRTELHRRRLSQTNSDAISDADQKEALRMAQRRLHDAEEKVERIKKWIPVLEHALSEYHSQAQPLGDRLSGSLVASLAMLERMITALDEYTAIKAPAAPVLPPTESGSTSTETARSGSAQVPAEPVEGRAGEEPVTAPS
jgi:hypothetical protein